jgi:hypothetical protein
LAPGTGVSLKNAPGDLSWIHASPGLRRAYDIANVPLYFIAHRGQADNEVLYYARIPSTTFWLTRTGIIFDSGRDESREVVRMDFVEPRAAVKTKEVDPASYRINNLEESDPSKWLTETLAY